MAEARQFVLNPETGHPAVVVVSHMDIEREVLEQAVATTQQELAATDTELESTRARVTELETERADREAAHEVAKSELSGYEAVAPSAGLDAGAEGASSEVADGETAPDEAEQFPQVA